MTLNPSKVIQSPADENERKQSTDWVRGKVLQGHPHPEEPRFRFIVPEEGFFSCVVEKEFPAIPSHLKWRRSPQKGERNSWVVPLFPESPRCSVHARETSFPCTASTFKPRFILHSRRRKMTSIKTMPGPQIHDLY